MEKAFRSILEGLAPVLGLSEINTDASGLACLLVIDDFEMSLRCLATGHVMLFTVIAPLPENNRQKIMSSLLDGNTFYHQTQGFTLGAREDTGVTLQGVISLRVLDKDNVSSYVQNFINVAEYWQKFCLECADEAPATANPSLSRLPDDIREMLYLRV